MGRSLVIVESPAKAKTINKFLGREFVVKASNGHIRDLPKSALGVDETSFEPTYTVLPSKKKTVSDLKRAARQATEIYLAPDPDREGEAICWHLKELLESETDAPFRRVLFHEITKRAIREAFDHPREIDLHKVDAQQARRILDRLVGYKISPLLWDKVRRGLSAGRVQSVALRIICEREREIQAFVPQEYWSVAASLSSGAPPSFRARLVSREGKKLELGSADEVATVLKEIGWIPADPSPTSEDEGAPLTVPASPGPDAAPFVVRDVQAKQKKKNPAPPFITSKLQQDAARRLGFDVRRTMRVAQGLYEGKEIGDAGQVGLITYMRTDSTRISEEALATVREHIRGAYGDEAVPEKPRRFRVAKAAQEAHEAIRPTSLELTPQAIARFLTRDELKLYTLIWNRFVASQMTPAVFDTTRVDIEAGPYGFRATGSVLRSPGWLAVYTEARDEDARRDNGDDREDDEDRRLPELTAGRELASESIDTRQHFTQPPPRFTEASLVKELEENGIGRPSTYQAIIETITSRDYADKDGRRFAPTELGFLVNDLMVESFGDIVDIGYTSRLEGELDRIEEGDLDWTEALRVFQKQLEADIERAKSEMRDVKREAIPTDQECDKCGSPMVIKWGRFGSFLACSSYPECKNTREIASVEEGSMPAAAKTVKKVKVKTEVDPIEAEADPCERCGKPMVLRRGRYGPFLACSSYPDCKNTRKITVRKDGKAEAKADVMLDEPCPRCGSQLARKQGRFGEFIACSNYPSCRYVKVKDTGVTCPDCGEGSVVERRSRRGKVFYGCDRYPKCEFVIWKKPVAKACPACGKPYLVERVTKRDGTQWICDAENCDHTEEPAVTAE